MRQAILAGLLAATLAGPAAAAEETVTGAAKARGPDTLAIGGVRFRLADVEAPDGEEACAGPSGEMPCPAAAEGALKAMLAAGEVTCAKLHRLGHGFFLGRCRLGDGSDPTLALLRAGLLRAAAEAPEAYGEASRQAQAAGAGVWRE